MDDIETTCDGVSDSMMQVRHAQGNGSGALGFPGYPISVDVRALEMITDTRWECRNYSIEF
jgi:hypothetical protein